MHEVLSHARPRHPRGTRGPQRRTAHHIARRTASPTTAWTAAEPRSFLRAATEDRAYPVFVLAVVYGLRRGEIAALHWDDIDFTRNRRAVRASLVRVDGRLVRGPVKTAAGVRALPLVALPRAALRARGTTRHAAPRRPSPSGKSRATCSPPAAGARSSQGTSHAPSTASSPGGPAPHRVPRHATNRSDNAQRPRGPRPRCPDHPRPRQHRRNPGRLQRGVRHRDRPRRSAESTPPWTLMSTRSPVPTPRTRAPRGTATTAT